MRVYMAGGIHEDPLCGARLVAWLHELVEKEGKQPRLVAVEHDPDVKGFFRMERAAFRNLASGLWGDAVDPAVADMLASALGWELDAHRVAIDTDPFYLDEAGSRVVAIKGSAHVTMVKTRLSGYQGKRDDVQSIAEHIEGAAVKAADEKALARFKDHDFREEQAKREAGWVVKLRQELKYDLLGKKNGWIVVIVGALHASRFDDRTFRNLLASTEGFEIADVRYLAWTPPQEIA